MTLRYDLNRFLKVLFAPTRMSLLKGSWQITSRIQQSMEYSISKTELYSLRNN